MPTPPPPRPRPVAVPPPPPPPPAHPPPQVQDTAVPWGDWETPGCVGLCCGARAVSPDSVSSAGLTHPPSRTGYRTRAELAAAEGHTDVVAHLLAGGPRRWEDSWLGVYGASLATVSPLAQAATRQDATSVGYLLGVGADSRRGSRICCGLGMTTTPLWHSLQPSSWGWNTPVGVARPTRTRKDNSSQEQQLSPGDDTAALRAATMSRLLDAGAHPDEGLSWGPLGTVAAVTPLSAAAAAGDAAAVAALLQAGADPSTGVSYGPYGLCGHQPPLDCAVEAAAAAHRARVAAAPDGKPDPPYVETSATACVRLLLQAGADPNAVVGGRSPLFAAASAGDAVTVDALLHAGARPDGGAPWLYGVWGHRTPLAVAAGAGDTVVSALLLRAGATVDDGAFCDWFGAQLLAESPLVEALRRGHTEVVELLAGAGAESRRPYRGLCGPAFLPPLPQGTGLPQGKPQSSNTVKSLAASLPKQAPSGFSPGASISPGQPRVGDTGVRNRRPRPELSRLSWRPDV